MLLSIVILLNIAGVMLPQKRGDLLHEVGVIGALRTNIVTHHIICGTRLLLLVLNVIKLLQHNFHK